MSTHLDIQDVLRAYQCGLFPMADSRAAEDFFWYDPPMRGQLPILDLHIPRRLRRTVLRPVFDVRINTDFPGVLDGCAVPTPQRPETWINPGIRDLFMRLYAAGYAHSIECWQDDRLVGGLYGLAIGSVFCGESMFSFARDASKVALVHSCARLWLGGFTMLDTQFLNPHLDQFGAYEIPRTTYLERLRQGLLKPADFRLSAYPGLDEAALLARYFEARTAKGL